MLGWTARLLLLWGGLTAAIVYAWENPALLAALGLSDGARPVSEPAKATTAAAPGTTAHTLRYAADRNGHVVLEAAVNGTHLRMLVDTGASFVTLTPQDARAAGINPGTLGFTRRVATANGEIRVAPVRLRELRIGQLAMDDVDAVVVEAPLAISLLGMSFLRRLESYEMRDGALVMSW